MTSNIIPHYYPNLTKIQIDQFDQLFELYQLWNAQINVISRKDIDLLYERHILHSLGIAKICEFKPGTNILDVGTGGGFPGIPLAILFPETQFLLVDSIGKKIKVVNEISHAIGLKNLKGIHQRAEQVNQDFDFIVSRAVTQLKDFYPWIKGKFKKQSKHDLKNGVLYLKGGDLEEELKASNLKSITLYPLSKYFAEEFFETKFVVYFPAQ
ncbi:MAG: 16S rRNA (guanine(527)-N(7))-methyltransferase RsmG [Bacteroidetes bacterium]|nr:16S rRNA (guanine(527)-N(7))-methyltransferase RsmG [Bacteroidota bacterium]MBU1371402.1 16S rRNA (guanine(527)-N(7))-methyltransferase RsmG [Bacteroidota bacterium]MBU1485673.1 16S rRNA (guanine(527)-N(7))-methyltransferase RsmG [Bacteroidota bacterium]MBU1761895.1 16S rRNA (guanine(527)-N(7))-methyltransferase RsmG [Bacteroidota bacterium]MBU2269130.1 16S rRNA (guanine(527)-N(7))-methyltransferase RsmG [Bacteroidota bacterium]